VRGIRQSQRYHVRQVEWSVAQSLAVGEPGHCVFGDVTERIRPLVSVFGGIRRAADAE